MQKKNSDPRQQLRAAFPQGCIPSKVLTLDTAPEATKQLVWQVCLDFAKQRGQRLGIADDSRLEDAVFEAVKAFLNYEDTLKCSAVALLRTIINRRVVDLLDCKIRENSRSSSVDVQLIASAGVSDPESITADQALVLERMLAKLTPKQYLVIFNSYHGVPAEQTAETLKTSTVNVYKIKSRALKQLRAMPEAVLLHEDSDATELAHRIHNVLATLRRNGVTLQPEHQSLVEVVIRIFLSMYISEDGGPDTEKKTIEALTPAPTHRASSPLTDRPRRGTDAAPHIDRGRGSRGQTSDAIVGPRSRPTIGDFVGEGLGGGLDDQAARESERVLGSSIDEIEAALQTYLGLDAL